MPLRASSHPGSPNSLSCSALAWYSYWPGLSPWGESWKRTQVARTAALTHYRYTTQPTCFVFELNRTSIKHFTVCLLNTVISIYISFLHLCLRAKSFCDCKHLSTIAWAEGPFSIAELPTVLFLLNNSPLFDVTDFPPPLFFALFEFTSDVLIPTLTTSLASVGCAALSSLLQTLSCLWRCLSLFLLTFCMLCQCIGHYCTHLAICPSYLPMYDHFMRIG